MKPNMKALLRGSAISSAQSNRNGIEAIVNEALDWEGEVG